VWVRVRLCKFGATGSHVTWEVIPAFFSYYGSSTKCNTVVKVSWLPEVTEGHVTPSGLPWVCACATGCCAISVLVGPFDRKWRHQTSPVGMSWKSRDRKCPWGAFYDVCILLSFSSPFTGYLPLSRHFISTFNNYTKVCCFRICLRLLCSTPRLSPFSLWYF
jgi:hypothetical protein